MLQASCHLPPFPPPPRGAAVGIAHGGTWGDAAAEVSGSAGARSGSPVVPHHLLLTGSRVSPGGLVSPSPGTSTSTGTGTGTGTGTSGGRAVSQVPGHRMVLTPRRRWPHGYGTFPGSTPAAGGEGRGSARPAPAPRAPAAPPAGLGSLEPDVPAASVPPALRAGMI